MEMADRAGTVLDEQVESAFLANYTGCLDVGDPGTGIASGSTVQITVTAANVDDIVRGIRRIITAQNGTSLAGRNGIFIVWRAADFELLEQFAQANGFNLADTALKSGIPNAYYFMGVYHYVSNSHTANHLLAGVRKIIKVGILRSTYGQLVISQDPGAYSDSKDQYSGIGLTSRVDYGSLVPTGLSTLVYDINVV